MIFRTIGRRKTHCLNTLGDELAAALMRFYAIEVDSRPGELEYDRALAAKKLEAAVAEIVATGGGRPERDDAGRFEQPWEAASPLLNFRRPRAQ